MKMKLQSIILLTIMLIVNNNAISQTKFSKIIFSFDTVWNELSYQIDELEVEGKTIRAITKNINLQSTIEFIRLDSNYYYCIEKDASNKTIAQGKAVLDKKPFRIESFPRIDSNGVVTGYGQFNLIKFSKEGKWIEIISDTTQRTGKYFKSKKTGIWTYSLLKRYKIPQVTEIYQLDSLVESDTLNFLYKAKTKLAQKIVGKWFAMDFGSTSDSYMFYSRKFKNVAGRNWHSLNFLASGICISENSSRKSKTEGTWKLDSGQNIVIVTFPTSTSNFSINYISSDMLVGYY